MPEREALLREFALPPSVWPGYLRALLAAGKPCQCATLPPLVVRVAGVRLEAGQVARFRRAFGLAGAGPVPPSYPQVLAFPLHLRLLTDRAFPLRVLGTVHLRSAICQYRALRADESVDVEVRLAGPRSVAPGIEYDLVTELRDRSGALVWTGTATQLLRAPGAPLRPRAADPGASPAPAWERAWNLWLPAGAGRRYAALSGDWNPIHLGWATARLFGFRRALLHGMCTWAHVLARLEPHLPEGALQADVQFRRPLWLPAKVVVHALRSNGQDAWRWSVQDTRATVTHAEGRAGPLD